MSIFSKITGAISSFQSVMSLLSSSLASDVVCIMDEDGRQLFETARAVRAMCQDDSELFQHPLETGNKTTDFKIDKPKVVQLAVVIPADDYSYAYPQLAKAKVDGKTFSVQTKARVYNDMVIQAMPHEEGEQWGDCLAVAITFVEVQWYQATVEMLPAKEVARSKKTGAKSDADTVKSGQQRASDASAANSGKATTILGGWFG